jgi:hypothetical protein
MNRRSFVKRCLVPGALGAAGGASAFAAQDSPRPDDLISVKAFGARGDGSADDTDAVERAVAAGGGVLIFPRGSYRLTRPVVVDLTRAGTTSIAGDGTARVLVDGAGPAFSFRGTHEGTADPPTMEDAVWARERLPLISGLEIRGLHPKSVGLRLEKTVQATITEMLIRRCATGIHLVERNRNLTISSCHVHDNLEVGIHFDHVNLHQAIITGSHVSYNPVAGIWIDNGEIRNFQIVGNDIEYNYDKLGKRQGSADVLFVAREAESSWRECTIVGNTIQARPSPGGANIRLVGNGGHHSGGMTAISGNLIGSQEDNIHIERCRNICISGNAIYSATRLTMLVERSSNLVLADNSIDWNPVPGGKTYVDGIRIDDSDGVNLSGTVLENCFRGTPEKGGAIEVARSRDVTITDCQVLDPLHRGIVLEEAVRCRVMGCSVVDRRPEPKMREAIVVLGKGSDNWITGNMFSGKPPRAEDPQAARIEGNLQVGGAG